MDMTPVLGEQILLVLRLHPLRNQPLPNPPGNLRQALHHWLGLGIRLHLPHKHPVKLQRIYGKFQDPGKP